MSRRTGPRPRTGEEHEIVVDRLAYGGSGVGRITGEGEHAGMAVFVPRSAPGDRLRVRLVRVQRRHAEASVLEVLEPGTARVQPPCPHYEQGCGGCSWQHLSYPAQLAAKESVVRDSLERIGGLGDVPMDPIVTADEPWWYRNKMEFTFNVRDGLGLHRSGDWRRIVPVSECRLESELAMRVLEAARAFAAQYDLKYWDPLTHTGLLREVVVRHGRGTSQTMVALVTAPGRFVHGPDFAARIAALDPSITSVLHAVRGLADGSGIESTSTLHGTDTITEIAAGLRFDIGLQTFFQTSTAQAEHMVAIVRDMAAETLAGGGAPRAGRLLDVFCGVGFFTLCLADLVQEAVGVEIVEPSIVAARANARTNGIDNAVFYAGDARRTLPEILESHGTPDLVVIDPPRSGAGGKVMRRLARAEPRRIVYVSCNPTTLARDLQELEPFGYGVTRVAPIDLFPQTYHVETIVAIDRGAVTASAVQAEAATG